LPPARGTKSLREGGLAPGNVVLLTQSDTLDAIEFGFVLMMAHRLHHPHHFVD